MGQRGRRDHIHALALAAWLQRAPDRVLDAWMSGAVIGIVALSTLITAYEWEEWLNLLLGRGLRFRHGSLASRL